MNEPKRIKRTALLQSLFTAVCGVLVGNYYWSTTGALVGAVLTVLVGFHEILLADRASSESEKIIQEQIREKEASIAVSSPRFFSENESVTGVPDGNFLA